jgi:putative ABC transport system permease protein
MPSDAVYAVRQLRRSPAFAAAAILTLALGIGANAAIYQVLDAVLFRVLPVKDPARLVKVTPFRDGKPKAFSYTDYRAIAAQPVFDGALASSDFPLHAAILRGRGQARTVNTVIVSAGYFQVLGIAAHTGRVFGEADDHDPVGVISDAFWEREFGRNPAALGQTLRINKSAITVIGVAPPRFFGEKPGNVPDLWVPLGLAPQLMASDWLSQPKSWLSAMARLRAGVSLADAQAAVQGAIPGLRILVEPGEQGIPELRTRVERPALVAMAAVGLLLLIACCNLATLLLARGAARSHEISVRLALGAGRGRLIRQLAAENMVLALIGGALGLALSLWLARPAAAMAGATAEWSWRVAAFTAGITALTGLLFGMAPAISATRPLTPRASRPKIGRALIAVQVAVSLVLLSGAGMLARSLWNLRHQDFGFRADGLVVADLPWEFSPAMMARYAALRQPLLERLQAVPGAQSAALSGFGPMGGAQHTSPFSSAATYGVMTRMVHVSARYFDTTEIPILAGRAFTDADRAGAPAVAVVTETAARALFGGANPVGKLISGSDKFDPGHAVEVVGVARDVRFASPTEAFSAMVFLPLTQSPAPITTALVRVSGDAGAAAANVRAAFRAVDPDIAIASVQPLPAVIDASLQQERALAVLANGFAALALVLTAVGIYGVISYALARRAREIGIRIALGARRGQVSRMLLAEIGATAAAGVAAGGVGAFAASRALHGMLFGIAPGDWSMTGGAAALLGLIAAIAAYVPARRASRLDPMATLRQD